MVALVIQVPVRGHPFLFLASKVTLDLILDTIDVAFTYCWLLRFSLLLTNLVCIENLRLLREVRRCFQA